jgi:hypothetical protein
MRALQKSPVRQPTKMMNTLAESAEDTSMAALKIETGAKSHWSLTRHHKPLRLTLKSEFHTANSMSDVGEKRLL